jgi:hypothetical protein
LAPHIPDSAVSFLRSKRGIVAVCAILLLAMFVVRPGASRLKTRIANSIGNALQRRVEIGSVQIRFLPRPGFDLDNFVVQDDPMFGAEPVLRAEEVSASLRLSSLLRGHIEISQLSLTEPSLNLTRNAAGRWNIENLLERTSATTVAPTAKTSRESRPAFPYIEADRGRINFKLGPEKKPFTLTEADYSFWQDSENTWGMRLKARPTRTDLSLSDTGQLRINGTWQRAGTLRETPLKFDVQWEGAQLGQASKFFTGQDKGWRGGISATVNFAGTPADLSIRSDAALEDFRRYDIPGGGSLTLHTRCEAHYSTVDRGLHQIFCQTPAGDGAIAVLGEVRNVPGSREYDLKLAADGFPAQSLLALIRHAKKDLPDDLVATGELAAEFNLRNEATSPIPKLTGSGRINDLHLRSSSAKTELSLGIVPFSVAETIADVSKKSHLPRSVGASDSHALKLIVGPFPLKLGRPAPATAQLMIAPANYDLAVNGEADIPRILQVARTIGLPAINPHADGWAKLDVHISGTWTGFATPKATGSAQLHAVRAELRGVQGPVEISSATVNLADSGVRVDSISASMGGSHWTGSLSFPRMCGTPLTCPLEFNVHADEVVMAQLTDAFRPHPAKKKWYGLLSDDTPVPPTFLAQMKATGKITVNRVILSSVVAARVSASIAKDGGRLDLSDLRADVLGGQHRGEWHADFSVSPPKYALSGLIRGASLTQLADAMDDDWITGTADAHYKIEAVGRDHDDLTKTAKGTLDFEMQEGALPHIAVTNAELKVRRFSGRLTIADGRIEMQDGRLQSPSATYAVTGNATLTRDLDFKLLQEGAPTILVTGTIADTQVEFSRRTETRAELKQ